jgi:hypothetical protein
VDQSRLATGFQLDAQVVDIDLDDSGLAIKVIVPPPVLAMQARTGMVCGVTPSRDP